MSGKVVRWCAPAVALLVLLAGPASSAARRAPDPTSRPRVTVPDAVRSIAGSPGGAWRAAAAPQRTFSFDAIAREGPHPSPDPTGALGAHWILTAADASYALYDLSGGAVIGPNPLASLLPVPARATVSDPRVVYDQYGGRFVLAYLVTDRVQERSWIDLITIPDATATNPATWCGSKVLADRTVGDGSQFADDLGLGYDGTVVAVTADMDDFAHRRFRGATVLGFPKARLYDCSRTIAFDTFAGRGTRAPTGEAGSALRPAVTVGHGRSLYLTSLEPGRSTFLILWRLTGKLGSMRLRSVALRVPRVRSRTDGSQGGSSAEDPDAAWDTGELAITSTFSDLETGRVYASHVAARDLGPDPSGTYLESVVRWYELDPAGALGASRVMRVGTVGTPQTDAGWPSLATDDAGNLFVTYTRASAITGEFLSAWIAEIVPGTTEATTQPLRLGGARYESTPGLEPWGRSSAMSRDPVDGGSVMAVNAIPVTDGKATTRDWREVVDIVSHAP